MNAKELLQSAPRLSESNRGYVLFNNGDRAIIVPPGVSGKKITVRACDADGVQSGPVKKISPKELRLEPLPAPPAPLRLAPWCVNCGSPASMRCTAWSLRSHSSRTTALGGGVLEVPGAALGEAPWVMHSSLGRFERR